MPTLLHITKLLHMRSSVVGPSTPNHSQPKKRRKSPPPPPPTSSHHPTSTNRPSVHLHRGDMIFPPSPLPPSRPPSCAMSTSILTLMLIRYRYWFVKGDASAEQRAVRCRRLDVRGHHEPDLLVPWEVYWRNGRGVS